MAADYNFSSLHQNAHGTSHYTSQDYDRLTSLLLFYEIGQEENLVDEWPSTLPALPHRVEFSWRHFCRQFKDRNSTHSWSEGPKDMDKYIGIAKCLVQPASFDTAAFRSTARDAVRKATLSSKLKQTSTPKS